MLQAGDGVTDMLIPKRDRTVCLHCVVFFKDIMTLSSGCIVLLLPHLDITVVSGGRFKFNVFDRFGNIIMYIYVLQIYDISV